MKVRPLAYFALLLLNLALLYIQFQLYATPEETVTSLFLGYYNIPKDRFVIVLISSLLMLPYMIALLIGATAEADWLYPTRLYACITAMMIEIARGVFMAVFTFWGGPEGQFFSLIDATFIYLLVEGTVTVLEGRISG